jgi:predicted transcriptional regulator
MKPTESELSILSVLWNDGPSTVRQVNEQLNKTRKVGYTNTLKMMQLMHEKGILKRDESSRSHIYESITKPEEVKQHLLRNMVDTVFGGKTSNLLLHALGNYTPSADELKEIKSMIDKLDNHE